MPSEPAANGNSDPSPGAEGFLAEVLPMLERMDKDFHDGDARPRHTNWSHHDPVTLFGAVMTRRGWKEVGPAFDGLAARFANCDSFRYEVMAAGVSGDLGYVVGIEHTTCSVSGGPVEAYELRVTTILRREDGVWKVVHRHGDTPPGSTGTHHQLGRLVAGGSFAPK